MGQGSFEALGRVLWAGPRGRPSISGPSASVDGGELLLVADDFRRDDSPEPFASGKGKAQCGSTCATAASRRAYPAFRPGRRFTTEPARLTARGTGSLLARWRIGS